MLGPQVGDDLRQLLITERIRKGRHLFSAVENLACHFVWRPELVLADVDERGSLFGSGAVGSVAVGATFVAEEDGAGFFGVFVLVSPKGVGGKRKGGGHEQGGGQRKKVSGSRVHE